MVKEDNVTSEQTFLVSIQVRDSVPSGTTIQPATIDQDYGFGAVGQTSETVFFSAFEQRIPVPFNLFADNLPEGTEAFQASVSPEDTRELRLPNGTIIVVERFPTPLDPVGLASEIFVIIEGNDRKFRKYFTYIQFSLAVTIGFADTISKYYSWVCLHCTIPPTYNNPKVNFHYLAQVTCSTPFPLI